MVVQVLKSRGNALQIHYAARSYQDMAFRDRLQREFSDDISVYSSADGERLNLVFDIYLL